MPNKSLELLRHELGSIHLSDIEEEKEQSEAERKEYCAAISAVWPRLEKDIKKFLHAQLIFIATQAGNWDQVLFGKGTFNGLDLLLEHWKKATAEHNERLKGEEKFDKHEPIGNL